MRAIARRAVMLAALISVATLLVSCSTPSAAPTSAPAPTYAPAAAATPAAARAATNTSGASSDSSSASQSKQSEPGGASGQATSQPLPLDRMIIRTSVVQMTVDDVEAALASIRAITLGVDGYVASSQSQYVGDKQTATIAVQVPAVQFDSVLNQVRKLGVKVTSENTTTQDVTEQYVDLQSQINNLKAAEASEVRLLDKATTMSDILAIQRELTSLRGQIEQAQGKINYLQRKSDYSSLTVQLTPVSAAVEPQATTSAWQPLRTITRAWQASLQTISTVADVVLAVVVFLWWLIPFVVLGIWFWRRQRRRAPRAPAPAGPRPAMPPPVPPSGSA